MRAALVIVLAVAHLPPAVADFIPCDACDRGEVLIARFGLGGARPLGLKLATLSLGEPLTAAQYAVIVELRKQTPALGKLGALDDTDLALVAAALCHHPDNVCTVATSRALRCLADRCEVELPTPRKVDVTTPAPECHRTPRKRSPPLGVGIDWGNGFDRSRYPNDGRSWSLGIEGRVQLGPTRGIVVRADHTAGRDQAIDLDGNGRDDMYNGSVTRFMALAGPSFVLDSTGFEHSTRFLRLDLLAGYLATLSQPGEDGVVAGFDLAYQVSVVRIGARFIQGFGDASSTTMVLAHLGIAVGSVPPHTDGGECSPHPRTSRLALGFELPLLGYGLTSQLGYMAIGLGVEMLWYATRKLDVVTHADMLVFPGDKRDRVIHQAALGGIRIDHGQKRRSGFRSGFHTTVLAGYTHGAGLTPTTAGTGPVADVSLGWGGQERDGAWYTRLHGRLGLSPANEDYRALFLSTGFELRFDPQRWRSRVRRSYW